MQLLLRQGTVTPSVFLCSQKKEKKGIIAVLEHGGRNTPPQINLNEYEPHMTTISHLDERGTDVTSDPLNMSICLTMQCPHSLLELTFNRKYKVKKHLNSLRVCVTGIFEKKKRIKNWNSTCKADAKYNAHQEFSQQAESREQRAAPRRHAFKLHQCK